MTKIIRLIGSMDFQGVTLGQTKTNTLTVFNDGNATLTFTGLTASGGVAAVIKATPTSGTILPGGKQDIVIQFAPTSVTNYTGSIGVTSDATSGTSTIVFTGQGTLDGIPIWTKSGDGNQVFDMPTYVRRVRIQGTWNRRGTSNFIVHVGGDLIVNAILRDSITSDGTYLVVGGVTDTVSSDNISWTFTEIR